MRHIAITHTPMLLMVRFALINTTTKTTTKLGQDDYDDDDFSI